VLRLPVFAAFGKAFTNKSGSTPSLPFLRYSSRPIYFCVEGESCLELGSFPVRWRFLVTDGQENISLPRKRGIGNRSLILLLSVCSGAIYLASQRIDWSEKFVGSRASLSDVSPAARTDKPATPAVAGPSFDIVSADENGMLVAAGKGEAGSTILLHNRTQTVAETKADENGEWVLAPEQPLAPGEYILSLTAVDPKTQTRVTGQRTFALSIAPRRETGKLLAKAQGPATMGGTVIQAAQTASPQPAADSKGCSVVVVKRGDTLWEMAHHCYGNGTEYQKIVRSNQTQIRDPNLIYPNQQFAMPR
jgi:nucleoid-associated protein YgaU